ncbi:uncharacterized protein YecE (DUF72 family) [Pseudomonas sp. JUb42]|uniref:DUF72 domain-containing protein n=1 Tax=Pseudomonas sp. JUb42 TaxID=2940611 RepID=UPI0021671E36|nr:DUF72 domain-containing protein [Pseudomonas sp. JUb42]MCS3468564.1 uncharacterized protein YecE (DUF72 family) [Pseudomonas sp. JUb42]
MDTQTLVVGCAGWSLGREYWPDFTAQGTHLQRYAARLNGVEINSSFYRPHRRQTYERWASAVPDGFRFSVKMPKQITHMQRLKQCEPLLDEFIGQCSGLTDKLGCVLVQLPPSLAFDERLAEGFFDEMRQRFNGHIAVEPRHESWAHAAPLLQQLKIAQVATDPSRISTDSRPAGWPGFRYWRLHGSPRVYYSAYGDEPLQNIAQQLMAAHSEGAQVWCIFDNTAAGAALGNALRLQVLLHVNERNTDVGPALAGNT